MYGLQNGAGSDYSGVLSIQLSKADRMDIFCRPEAAFQVAHSQRTIL